MRKREAVFTAPRFRLSKKLFKYSLFICFNIVQASFQVIDLAPILRNLFYNLFLFVE